jgi:hypothetical protein
MAKVVQSPFEQPQRVYAGNGFTRIYAGEPVVDFVNRHDNGTSYRGAQVKIKITAFSKKKSRFILNMNEPALSQYPYRFNAIG